MKNKEILNKLIKVVSNRQKLLNKLAQAIATPAAELPVEAHNYIKSITSLWISNNGYPLSYTFTLQDSNDPSYNYDLAISLKPARIDNHSITSSIANELKDYLAAKLANNNFFKGKNIKINIQLNKS